MAVVGVGVGRQRTLSIGLEGGATEVVCGGCGAGRSDRLEIQSGHADGMFWVLEQEQFGWEQGEARMALWVLEEALKMRGHCLGMRLIERSCLVKGQPWGVLNKNEVN